MYVCMYVCIDILFLGGDFPKNYYNHEARVVSMFLCIFTETCFTAKACTTKVQTCAHNK